MNPPPHIPSFRAREKLPPDRAARKAFYDSARWKKARLLQLQRSPLCEICLRDDRVTPGEHVHHIEKLADAPGKALDLDNLQTLCAACHSRMTGKGF